MAAWPASLFGREKAGTGAVCLSRSHARLETRPRAQAVNARGRREGKGGWDGWGWTVREHRGAHRQTDTQDHVPTSCAEAQSSLLYFLTISSILTCHSIATCLVQEEKSCPDPFAQHSPVWELGCWDLCEEDAHSYTASGCSHCWARNSLHPHDSRKS